MKTETKTPTVSENFTLIEAAPKRRGRPPGSKSKPKAKAKPVVKTKVRKAPTLKGIPRTARAYMYRYADRRFDTEASAVVELVRLFDEAVNRLNEKGAPKNEIKLGGFRQFLVNFCAGQPVKVLPRK